MMIQSPSFKIGQVLTTEIRAVAFGGDGIGRVEGVVVFVPFTLDGDVVELEIREVKRKYLRGRLRTILTPSARRASPPCPYFGRCGGCQYQHVDYEKQLELKTGQVIDAFERVGGLKSPPVQEIIPSPRIYGYRMKGEYHVQPVAGKAPVIGFLDAGGRRLVDIQRCEIMDGFINDSCAAFRGRMTRMDPRGGESRLVLWARENGDADEAADRVRRTVKGKVFKVPRDGFFQANGALVATLVDEVIRLSAPSREDRVIECYCGSGLFSAFLAERCGVFAGIEIDAEAVECARENLEGISNSSLYCGDVRDILRADIFEDGPADLIVMDPPRRGCEKDVLLAVSAIAPRRIVYVACDPATQARDVAFFVQEGYELKAVQPLDMFPQTKHIEAVALLEKRRG
ncbi:MAG TPA: class I SAM-dependent RNA methyltransferase [Syntrophales bacterium]|jgi:tRNA/tmRNA/rRNA uracil-C5-methylase (TrmA/RlmC/RlmD family)|nr:class I SAM-dependent RNA methyltransferase [Syntrophales bacterium]HRT62452.1 class I SAM-dependent RNA methyltransferase [Syntrophales bacterium]